MQRCDSLAEVRFRGHRVSTWFVKKVAHPVKNDLYFAPPDTKMTFILGNVAFILWRLEKKSCWLAWVSYQLVVLLTTKELQSNAYVLEVTWGTAASASLAHCACVIGGGLMPNVDLVGIVCSNSDTAIKMGTGLTRPQSLICLWYRLLSKLQICCQLLTCLKLVFHGFEVPY